MMVADLACACITLGALVYVFYLPGKLYMGPEKTRLSYLRERKEAVYENLRDLNFEYKAGKLPDADYQSIKASLEEEAAAVLSEIAQLEQVAAASRVRTGKGARV
jgi:outer membrane protein TolC